MSLSLHSPAFQKHGVDIYGPVLEIRSAIPLSRTFCFRLGLVPRRILIWRLRFRNLGAFLQLRRSTPHRSPWRRATFETLRRAFHKIAVRIEELGTRIKIALPSAYHYRKAMTSMAGSIAAQGP